MRDALPLRFTRPGVRSVDAIVSAALTAFVLVGLLARPETSPIDFLAAPVLTSTVAWRRWSPVGAVVVGLLAATGLKDPDPVAQSVLLPIVVMLVYYALGRRDGSERRYVVDGVCLAVALPSIWFTPGDSHLVDVTTVWIFFFALPYLAGRVVATQSTAARELERETAQAEVDQRMAARRAVVTERTRIARDLHDVIAHHLSVMAIQAVAARRTAPTDPETARRALATVASCGRETLVELRQMVDVLGREDPEASNAADLGLDRVPALAQHVRLAGPRVDVRVRGQRFELSPEQDLVAFRVVQEALTNVLKHARAARVSVSIRYLPGEVELRIVDDGAGVAETDRAPLGHGLVGMRERVTASGGTLLVGPQRLGGFEVRATLPRQVPGR